MLLDSSWIHAFVTFCDVMKLVTVDSSAGVVMYTMVAEATVQAFTAFDQDKGEVRSKYSYGETSVWAVIGPPGLDDEHRAGGGDKGMAERVDTFAV